MTHATQNTTEPKNTFSSLLIRDTVFILDLLACVYILMVTVLLPLYQKGTYVMIGTAKRELLISFLPLYLRIAVPFLGLYLLLRSTLIVKEAKKKLKTSGKPLRNLFSGLAASFNALDWFVPGYLIAVLLSHFFSEYKESAYIGADGWSMGTLMQASLAVTYFIISRFWKKRPWMMWLMLPVSGFQFILGYFNRFNIWPIPMEANYNPQFIALSGNINWYCGYMVTILFFGVYIAWAHTFTGVWQQYLLRFYLFVGFGALITNGSSSGILTLLAILFVLLRLSASDSRKMERYCEICLILGLSCLFTMALRLIFPDAITYQETSNNLFTYSPLPLILTLFSAGALLWTHRCRKANRYPASAASSAVKILTGLLLTGVLVFILLLTANTLLPEGLGVLSGSSLFTFSPEWGSRRGATWIAGLLAWWELPFFRKIIGVGPDSMKQYLYTDAGQTLQTMLYTIWPEENLSNAHCEWLTILVNLGIFGLITFAGMMISAIRSFLRQAADQSTPFHYLTGACGLSILAYTIHNMVSFQQVLNEPAMFVILGMGAAFLRPEASHTA